MFGSLESACKINNCLCILKDFLPSRKSLMGKELHLEIQHQNSVSEYALGQANKSARWVASSAKVLCHLQILQLL